NTTAVTPEPSRGSCACPTRTPATSVIRFCQLIFCKKPSAAEPSTPTYHIGPSHRCDAAVSRLPLVSGSSHLGAHDRRSLSSCRIVRGPDQLPVALRLAAGAALSGVPGRVVAGAARGRRARAARQARRACGRAVVRSWILDRFRSARRRRERHRRIVTL